MSACSCNAGIQWRVNDNTGRRAPIDMKMRAGGNIALVGKTMYRVMNEAERSKDELAYVVHYSVCPDVLNNPKRDPVAHRGTERA
jgi:tRNA threonylcarbamoyladenosine modification (KEOPS) complex  Pcc1 subunit